VAQETYNTDRKRLLIHPGQDPSEVPVIFLDENQVVITEGKNESSIMVAANYGLGFQGPISIQTSPDQIRFSALWKINPLVLSCLPSTSYTPIPWLKQSIPSPPKEMIRGIVSMAMLLTALM
jgi:hypothetical protein